MGSTVAGFQPSSVCAVRNLLMGLIERRKFKDQIEFLEKLHIKFQIFYLMGLPLAGLSSPYLQKIMKRVPERISGGHHFEEANGKIIEGFNHMESQYMPSWREIGEIWKNHLHISLHSAGCFLNPKYLEWSGSDPNIVEDTNLCMIHMGGDPCVQNLLKLQIEKYQKTLKLQIEKHRTRQQTSCESTSYAQILRSD